MTHLSVVPGEPDQSARLKRFKAANPDIPVILGSGMPTAFVGMTRVRRTTLRGLLDQLEEMAGDRPPDPPVPALRGVRQDVHPPVYLVRWPGRLPGDAATDHPAAGCGKSGPRGRVRHVRTRLFNSRCGGAPSERPGTAREMGKAR